MTSDSVSTDSDDRAATTDPVEPGNRPVDFSLSLIDLLRRMLERPFVSIGLPLIGGLILGSWTLLAPPNYTATATFMSEGGQDRPAQLSGLAEQFGIQIPARAAGHSPRFYVSLLTSRTILDSAVQSQYHEVRRDSRSAPDSASGRSLIDIFGIEAPSNDVELLRARRRLEKAIEAETDGTTDIVHLSVSTRWPSLSRQIAQRLIDLVNWFGVEKRQSQAEAKRKFLADRVNEARQELRRAEQNLEDFLSSNRQYQNSPELRFQFNRLQRRVSHAQRIYTSLIESYEEARIDEVRDTPVINVLQKPTTPPRADRQFVILKTLTGAVIGGVFAITLVVARHYLDVTSRREPDVYENLKRSLRDLWEPIRRAVRR